MFVSLRLPLLLPLLLLISCQRESSKEAPSRPNIIFILADDHAAQAISAYGSGLIRTPHIDRLGEQGMRLDNVFCTNGICAPSRATILTGQFSHHNGVLDNALAFDGSQPTFPKLLQAAGYRTAAVGKWHLKSDPTGFDYWNILPGQGDYYNPAFIEMGQRRQHTGYVTDLTTDLALAWLDTLDGAQPFFLFLGHKAPHRNWMPGPDHLADLRGEDLPEPPTLFDDYATRSAAAREQEMSIDKELTLGRDLKLRELDDTGGWWPRQWEAMNGEQRQAWTAAYERENKVFIDNPPQGRELTRWKYQRYVKDYLRTVASVDDNVGRLLDYLDQRGLAGNTIVVYSSDQGFFLGEHGWFDKRFMYEESLRMPFLFRYPGAVPAGTSSAALAMNVDFAPTLLDFAGVDIPADLPGRSLRPVLESGQTPATWRGATYYHYYEYPAEHMVKRHYGIRTPRYKLIHFYHDIDAWELFDLREDPREVRNLYGNPAYARVQDSLTSVLRGEQQRYGDDPREFASGLERQTVDHLARGGAIRVNPTPVGQFDTASLNDGRYWRHSRYAPIRNADWLGWQQRTPVEIVVDLGRERALRRVAVNCYQQPGTRIYYPEEIECSLSGDGQNWRSAGGTTTMNNDFRAGTQLYEIELPERQFRYIRLTLKSMDYIPAEQPGGGEIPWLMVDEVVVR